MHRTLVGLGLSFLMVASASQAALIDKVNGQAWLEDATGQRIAQLGRADSNPLVVSELRPEQRVVTGRRGSVALSIGQLNFDLSEQSVLLSRDNTLQLQQGRGQVHVAGRQSPILVVGELRLKAEQAEFIVRAKQPAGRDEVTLLRGRLLIAQPGGWAEVVESGSRCSIAADGYASCLRRYSVEWSSLGVAPAADLTGQPSQGAVPPTPHPVVHEQAHHYPAAQPVAKASVAEVADNLPPLDVPVDVTAQTEPAQDSEYQHYQPAQPVSQMPEPLEPAAVQQGAQAAIVDEPAVVADWAPPVPASLPPIPTTPEVAVIEPAPLAMPVSDQACVCPVEASAPAALIAAQSYVETPAAPDFVHVSAGDWWLGLASFRKEHRAQQALAELQALGLPASYSATWVKGRRWYRLHTGPFVDQATAESERRAARQLAGGTPWVYRN